MNNAIEFLKKRRSIYAIGRNIELNNEEITELIKGAVKNSPTAFNSPDGPCSDYVRRIFGSCLGHCFE